MKNAKHYAQKYKQMYMRMAETCAEESVATRLQVGCVILTDKLAVFHGFNGMPSGSSSEECEDNNRTKPEVIHAEDNAIRKASQSLGLNIYDASGSVAFITHAPCKGCAQKLIDFGISTVYYKVSYKCKGGIDLLTQAGIEVNNVCRY